MSSLVETGGGYAKGTTNTYSARSVGDPKADTIKVLYNKSTGKVIAMHTLELTQLIWFRNVQCRCGWNKLWRSWVWWYTPTPHFVRCWMRHSREPLACQLIKLISGYSSKKKGESDSRVYVWFLEGVLNKKLSWRIANEQDMIWQREYHFHWIAFLHIIRIYTLWNLIMMSS